MTWKDWGLCKGCGQPADEDEAGEKLYCRCPELEALGTKDVPRPKKSPKKDAGW